MWRFGKPVGAWGSVVKKTLRYRERDDAAREQFVRELAAIPPAWVVYLDESGLDDTLQRDYGRAPRGTRVMGEVSGKRTQRLSLIAAYQHQTLTAPMCFDGYCDTEGFNHWIEHCLLPGLTPQHTVILDNASFHKSSTTQQLIASKGCTLKFLPPYLPDLNPIEQQWAILKQRIRHFKTPAQSLDAAIDHAFTAY